MKRLLTLSLAVALFAACGREAEEMAETAKSAAGAAAPAFTLPDTAGKNVSLSDYAGKYVVLEWHNKDCPYVVKHYKSGNMQALQKKYAGKGVIWLSIISSAPGKQGHVDGPTAHKDMMQAGGAQTATLLDPDGKVGRLYGAKTTPHMYVVSPKGELIYNGAIDSIRSADPADIAEAENYVVSALDAAMAGQAIAKAVTKPYGCSVKYGS